MRAKTVVYHIQTWKVCPECRQEFRAARATICPDCGSRHQDEKQRQRRKAKHDAQS